MNALSLFIVHACVIMCFSLQGLTESCANQMHLLAVRVQTRDYKQDYVLTHACKKEVSAVSPCHLLTKDQ